MTRESGQREDTALDEASASSISSPDLKTISDEEPSPIFSVPSERPSCAGVSIIAEERRVSSGNVFSGWQTDIGRVLVLVSRWLLPPDRRAEIPLMSARYQSIEHASLPCLTAFDHEAERAWFVLADPAGISLSKVLGRHGTPRFTWSTSVMLQIARGVALLHEKELLHLDIRPSSIQVNSVTGDPSLVSMGFFQPRGGLLRSVMKLGQIGALEDASTMAPELVDAELYEGPSQATDVYALGATLYTLLSGTQPFTGGTVATILRKVVSEDPVPLGRLVADIPEALDSLCIACLKKNPRERPRSVDEFVNALASIDGVAAPKSQPGPVSLSRVIQHIGDYRVVRLRERRGATVLYEVLPKRGSQPLMLELGPLHRDESATTLKRQRELVQRVEDHPYVLRIHEIGLHEGRRFTVTDMVRGRPLEDLLAEGSLPVRRAAEITRDIAVALSFCHNYGVVHRGARPDLILVEDEGGRALLTSLGRSPEMAEEGGGPTTLMSRGLLFSTLFYFAPEQISEFVGTIDGQSDTYVLGVSLYEMLTGRRPFGADGPRALLQAIMAGEPRSPQNLNHQVDGDLAAICLKAMAADKDARYLTARELQRDLELWLAGRPVHARPRGPVSSALRKVLRRVSLWLRRARGATLTGASREDRRRGLGRAAGSA
jgi:serine/threonine protein kinase